MRQRKDLWTCQNHGSSTLYTPDTKHIPHTSSGRSNQYRVSPPRKIGPSIWIDRSTSTNTNTQPNTVAVCKVLHLPHMLHTHTHTHTHNHTPFSIPTQRNELLIMKETNPNNLFQNLQVAPLSTISAIRPNVTHGHQHVKQPAAQYSPHL